MFIYVTYWKIRKKLALFLQHNCTACNKVNAVQSPMDTGVGSIEGIIAESFKV